MKTGKNPKLKNLKHLKIRALKYIIYFLILFFTACSGNKNLTKTNKVGFDVAEYKRTFSDACKAKMVDDKKQAVELYSKCIELNPKSDASYYQLANIAISIKDFKKAEFYIKYAAELKPDNYWYQLLMAELFRISGNNTAAIKEYESLTKKYPKRTELQQDLASYYLKLNRPTDALNIYTILEERNGISEELSLRKIDIYQALNNAEQIRNEINKLISAFPNNLNYLDMLADYYIAVKEFDKAYSLYSKLLEKKPGSGDVLLDIANYYQLTKQPEESYKYAKQGFADNRTDLSIKIEYLLTFMNRDPKFLNQEKVYMMLDTLLITHPKTPKLNLLYADFLEQDKKYAEAKLQIKESLTTDKSDPKVWERLLRIESYLGEFQTLFDDSYSAMEYFPNLPIFYYYNGIAAMQLYKYDKAKTVLKNGLDIVVENDQLAAQFYYYLGEINNKTKSYIESDEAFDKSLELMPNNDVALNNYSYYLSLRGEKLQKAKELSAKSNQLNPNDPIYLDTYAYVLYKMNDFKEARINIEKAIQLGGDKRASILEHYGDILYKLGETESAIVQWKNALKLGTGSDKLREKAEKGILID